MFLSTHHHVSLFKLRPLVIALVPCLSCVTMFGYAQEQPAIPQPNNKATPTAHFDTITVTATKTSKKLIDTPIPVTLITQQQLQQNHARTLKQALELLPNVNLRPIHGKTGYELIMQGFAGDQVLILIDGLPITASTGSTVNLSQYLNVDVEQIEVIQGAASAQYGSSAMGGVINVITKRIQSQKAPITGHISAELASNGEQNPANHSIDDNRKLLETSVDTRLDKDGHWVARLSGSYLKDEGLTTNHHAWTKIKDRSEQSQFSGKLVYRPIINDVNKQAWLETSLYKEDDQSRFTRQVASITTNQQKEETIEKNRVALGFSHLLDNTQISALSGAKLQTTLLHENYQSNSNTYNVVNNNPILESDRDTEITTQLAQAQLDFPLWKISENHQHLLQIGSQWQQDKLSQQKNGNNELVKDNVKRDVAELYLQDDWFIGKNWEVVTGIRYQNDSDFGGHVTPKIAVKYNHLDKNGTKHIWRASIGQGYRVPNLKERYYVFDHSNLGYKVMGNPNLKPETSTSYQLSYQSQLSDKIAVTANAFYNDVENLIQTDNENPRYDGHIAIFQYLNAKEATTYGGDIGLSWFISDDRQIQANYAYTHTHNKQTNTELVSRPKHKASLSFTQRIRDNWQWINRINYESKHLVSSESKKYSPSWWTWDSKLNYQATPWLTLHTAINNLFDTQRDIKNPDDQRPIDNRQWLIGATYNF